MDTLELTESAGYDFYQEFYGLDPLETRILVSMKYQVKGVIQEFDGKVYQSLVIVKS